MDEREVEGESHSLGGFDTLVNPRKDKSSNMKRH